MRAIWKRTGEIVTVQGLLSDGLIAIETLGDSDWPYMPWCVSPDCIVPLPDRKRGLARRKESA